MTARNPRPTWKERLRHPSRRLQWTINVAGILLIWGAIYGIPEMLARRQTVAACEAVPLGSVQAVDRDALNALRARLRDDHGSLYATAFYPRDGTDFRSGDEQPTTSTTGAVILVFLGGFPFGREWCVLDVENGFVHSRRTFFGTDDYAYCDGDVRHSYFECSGRR